MVMMVMAMAEAVVAMVLAMGRQWQRRWIGFMAVVLMCEYLSPVKSNATLPLVPAPRLLGDANGNEGLAAPLPLGPPAVAARPLGGSKEWPPSKLPSSSCG